MILYLIPNARAPPPSFDFKPLNLKNDMEDFIMKYKFTSITESKFEKLVERCNFTEVELQIVNLRRKGRTPDEVSVEIGYSPRQTARHTKNAVAKIVYESENWGN